MIFNSLNKIKNQKGIQIDSIQDSEDNKSFIWTKMNYKKN